MFKEYLSYDATGLAELIGQGQVSQTEVLEAALARAREVDGRLGAICIPMDVAARQRALQTLSGPFAGVPFLIKDIAQDYADVPSTAGSRAFRNWCPKQHSGLVQRFLDAGLIIFGKTAVPELALKANTASSLWGTTSNPWDLGRTPGGSSGGAAAAVAAGIVPMAGASDGGGSIRIPASYCGLFGLRPSRGRVPAGPVRGEYWDGASSEHALSRSVRDSARLLDAIVGPDCGAPFIIASPERPFSQEVNREPARLRIGFSVKSPIGTPVHPDYVQAVRDTAKLLSSLGHDVEEAEPEIDGLALARSYITMYCGHVEASFREAQLLTGAKERDFEFETRVLALLGRTMNAGDFVVARSSWNDYARALGKFHQTYDLYMTPSVAQPPIKHVENEIPVLQRLAGKLVLLTRAGKALLKSGFLDEVIVTGLQRVPFTQLSNLTGTPSMSVPLHMIAPEENARPLPFGVQFVARFGDEATLFRLAAQLERTAPWASRLPINVMAE